MGKLLAFPFTGERAGGVVHVWPSGCGRFEIAHESASGNSWGYFEVFDCPQIATAAAYALNRDILGGSCAVHLNPAVIDALPVSPAPDREGF